MSAQNSKYGHLLDKLSSTGVGRPICSCVASAIHTHMYTHIPYEAELPFGSGHRLLSLGESKGMLSVER